MPEERTVLGGAPDVLTADGLGSGLKYPIRGHRFTVTLDALGLMSFKSVDGFTAELGSTEYREGAFATLGPRKIPTMLSYPDITLAKGMYNALTLYDFFMGYLNGKNTTVGQMIIEAYDNADTVVARWEAINVWPTSYEGGSLSADSSDILVETVRFATEGVYRLPV